MEEMERPEEPKGTARVPIEVYIERYARLWLLDTETSGPDWEKHSIIALRLVRLEGWEAVEERTILVRPEKPLSRQAEKLTGISNRELEGALTLKKALAELEGVTGGRSAYILDRESAFPFLIRAYGRCNRRFPRNIQRLDLRLDGMGIPGRQSFAKLFKALPPVPAGVMPDVPPKDWYMQELYELTRRVIYQSYQRC